jgi:putative aldouronate transport system substrate-binding protein
MKKMALLLAAAISLTMFTACGTSPEALNDTPPIVEAASEETATPEATEESPVENTSEETGEAPYEITMPVVTWGQTPAEIAQVEEAINKIILPEINATVSLQPAAAWDIINETQMALTAGEKMDIVNIFVFGAGMYKRTKVKTRKRVLLSCVGILLSSLFPIGILKGHNGKTTITERG